MAFSTDLIFEVQNGGSDTANGGAFRGGSPLSAPSAPTVSNTGGGGTIAAGIKYFVITHTDSSGQTGQSSIGTTTTSGTTSSITVNAPVQPTDGQYWSIYGGVDISGPYYAQGGARPYGTNVTLTTLASSGVQAPGVDYSQATSPQITFSDLVIDGTTNTTGTSAGHPCTASLVGNTVIITGGTGFTTQTVEILGMTSAGAYLFDKSLGTLSSTGGAGGLGGCLASPGKAAGLAATSRNGIFVKYNATAYTISSSNNVAGGRLSLPTGCFLCGYDSTRKLNNTDANRPKFNTNANTFTVVYMGGTCLVRQISITNTNVNTSIVGFQQDNSNSIVEWCKTSDIATGFKTSFQISETRHCEAVNYSAFGFDGGNNVDTHIYDCHARGGTLGTSKGFSQHKVTDSCVCSLGNGDGFDIVDRNWLAHCVANGLSSVTGNGGYGYNISGTTGCISLKDCAASNCNTAGLKHAADAFPSILRIEGLGTYNNTLALSTPAVASQKIDANSALITVGTGTATVNPWTDTSTFDYTTNGTASGGAVFRAGGRPTLLPGGAGTSAPDIGYAQTTVTSGGLLVHPGMGGGARG